MRGEQAVPVQRCGDEERGSAAVAFGQRCAACGLRYFVFLPTGHQFASVLQHAAATNQTKSIKLQLHHRNMPLGRSDATPHHSYFAALAVVVIIVLAVLPFACEGPLRRWNKNRRGRLE